MGMTGLIGAGVVNIVNESRILGAEAAKLKTEKDALHNEQTALESRLLYLKEPENFLKEVKSQFNYRSPGENLMIIIPNATSAGE